MRLGSDPVGIVVGICGGSGSGKSTLAHRVAESLDSGPVSILGFDAYYRDHGHLSPEERALVNYDHPDSLDVELFVEHLDRIKAGHSVQSPVYNFSTHTRSDQVIHLDATPIVIVEGILILAFEDIRKRFDLTIYRSCPASVRLARRMHRDVAERGRTPESVAEQFAATVGPMHDRFVLANSVYADLIVDHEDFELDEATGAVVQRLRQLEPSL